MWRIEEGEEGESGEVMVEVIDYSKTSPHCKVPSRPTPHRGNDYKYSPCAIVGPVRLLGARGPRVGASHWFQTRSGAVCGQGIGRVFDGSAPKRRGTVPAQLQVRVTTPVPRGSLRERPGHSMGRTTQGDAKTRVTLIICL
jgi:hypothetical protein